MARSTKPPDSPPGMPREVKQSYTKTIFPKPEAYKSSIASFEKWLKSFTPECRARVTLSLYRDWPRINLKQIAGEQYERRIFFYESSLDPSGFVFAPDFSFRDFVLHNQQWGGEGEYRILCNEQGVKGAIGCSEFTLEDPDCPPRVDVRSLVQGFPRNEGFIKGLRAKGVRLPGDDPEADRIEKEQESEMNVAEPLVQHVLKQNADLIEEIREREDAADAEPSVAESMMAQASGEAVKLVAHGAKEGMSMVAEQAKELAKATAPQFDPIKLFEVGRASAGDGGMAMLQLMMASTEKQMATMKEMHKETLDYMREKDERREEVQAVAPVAEQASGVDLLLQEGQKFKQLGDLFGWSTRRSRNDDEPASRQIEPPKESIVDKLFSKLAENPAVLVTGVFAVTNLIQTVMGRGKPVEEVMATANKVAAGVTGAVEKPAEPSADQLERQRLGNFLRAIEPLLITHFFDEKKENLNGYSFAEDFLTATADPATGQLRFTAEGPETELGQQQYHAIRQGGIAQFDRIIRDYQPLWGLLGGNLAKYQQFLEQFFTYPEAAQRAADERKKKLATVPSQPAN